MDEQFEADLQQRPVKGSWAYVVRPRSVEFFAEAGDTVTVRLEEQLDNGR
jgi:hypothetical protein